MGSWEQRGGEQSRRRRQLGADAGASTQTGRLRCDLGCGLGSRAPVPRLLLPFSSSRLPSSACEPPQRRRLRPGAERLCSRIQSRRERGGHCGGSGRVAGSPWAGAPGEEDHGENACWSCGSPVEARVRGIFSVMIWLPGAPAGARLQEETRLRGGLWEARAGGAHGGNFSPLKVPASARLRAAVAATARRRLGLAAVAGFARSWPSLGLKIWGRGARGLADRNTHPRVPRASSARCRWM